MTARVQAAAAALCWPVKHPAAGLVEILIKKLLFFPGVAAAAGALVMGWGLMPARQPQQPLATSAGQTAFGGCRELGADDRVVVMEPKRERDQGVHTRLAMVLAMMLAEALGADRARASVEHPPIDKSGLSASGELQS